MALVPASPKNIPNDAIDPLSLKSCVIRARSELLAIPVIVNIIDVNRLYVTNA